MRRSGKWLIIFAILGMVAAGCTTTTTQKGAVIGAAAGALVGQAAGRSTTGTVIGATAGGLTGALVGDVIQKQQVAREAAERDADEARRDAEAARSQESQPSRTAAVTYPKGQYQADPTVGEFANNTRWDIRVYMDASTNDLNKIPHFTLHPYETAPANLDVGEHRVSAMAYVKTQFGERKVGDYDQNLYVDPRGSGWNVNFDENSFR